MAIPLAFTDTGHGPPVVLLHAFPLCRDMWQPQVDDLHVPADQRDAVQRYLAEKFENQLRIDHNTLKTLDAAFKQEAEAAEECPALHKPLPR